MTVIFELAQSRQETARHAEIPQEFLDRLLNISFNIREVTTGGLPHWGNILKSIYCALASASFLVASAVSAEPVWDKVDFGMARAQVEALYPKGGNVDYQSKNIEISHISVTDKCQAEVNIRFSDTGVVDNVMIAGNPSMGGRCSNDVMTNLSAKYGQPANWDSSHGSILARQGKVAVWSRPDGVAMRFKKYENGIFGGGGLAKASWELTYTKLDGKFAL